MKSGSYCGRRESSSSSNESLVFGRRWPVFGRVVPSPIGSEYVKSADFISLGATENGLSSNVNLALDILRLFNDVGRSPRKSKLESATLSTADCIDEWINEPNWSNVHLLSRCWKILEMIRPDPPCVSGRLFTEWALCRLPWLLSDSRCIFNCRTRSAFPNFSM